DGERDRRRGRRDERVHLLEDAVVLVLYERADLLGFHVVGVVVAGRERVRAEDHPTLHLRAEAFAAGAAIRLEQVGSLDAQAVADAVVAREVRGGFGRLDDVVDGKAVVGQRERDLFELRALTLELLEGRAHGALDAWLHALD